MRILFIYAKESTLSVHRSASRVSNLIKNLGLKGQLQIWIKSAAIVFRCEVAARTIANALRDICKKILIERSLAQSSSKLTEKLVSSDRR